MVDIDGAVQGALTVETAPTLQVGKNLRVAPQPAAFTAEEELAEFSCLAN
ncbi:MAG: hypothetical protein JO023_24895 [Chloroflexi bacterium]|nr:hypothetical protein [Chloroflexota bacterium]